eukprot:15475170-Alexandrium_andersonii.AAC.1
MFASARQWATCSGSDSAGGSVVLTEDNEVRRPPSTHRRNSVSIGGFGTTAGLARATPDRCGAVRGSSVVAGVLARSLPIV